MSEKKKKPQKNKRGHQEMTLKITTMAQAREDGGL